MQVSSYAQSNYIDFHSHVRLTRDREAEQEDIKEQEKTIKDKELKSSSEDKNDKTKPKTANELDPAEEKLVKELQARDAEVRAHEAAHLAAAGGLAAGGASYTYQQGPDGKQYAIGGEVPIHISKGSTPQETIANMQQVKAAASAPADPSGQDMKIAATAAIMEMKARAELIQENKEEIEEKTDQKQENTFKNPYEKEENKLIPSEDDFKPFSMSA